MLKQDLEIYTLEKLPFANINEDNMNGVILLNIRKVFDLTDHQILNG